MLKLNLQLFAASTGNVDALFPSRVNVGLAKVLTANTNLDGTGTVVTGFTAGPDGSICESLTVWHLGINVATVLRVFLKIGSVYSLILEDTIAANPTLSQTAKSVPYRYKFDGTDANYPRILLPVTNPVSTIVASVGTTIAAGLALSFVGGDY